MNAPSRAEALLFDLDGVLVDSRPAWYAALAEIQREVGLPITGRETFDRTFGQSTEADARDFFDGRLSAAALTARYEAVFPRYLGDVRRMEADSPECLDAWGRDGHRLAVVTNAPGNTALAMLTQSGLVGVFGVVVTPESAPPKPAPDMLALACRILDVVPAAALLVGDTETDVAAGVAAGVRVIGYRRPGTAGRIERLAELARFLG